MSKCKKCENYYPGHPDKPKPKQFKNVRWEAARKGKRFNGNTYVDGVIPEGKILVYTGEWREPRKGELLVYSTGEADIARSDISQDYPILALMDDLEYRSVPKEQAIPAAPKFKVGDPVNHSVVGYGIVKTQKYDSDCKWWTYDVQFGTDIWNLWEENLTPDTRPRIRVTAIDKKGKLHKWAFRGEPDWKRIEREVFQVGVAAVIEGDDQLIIPSTCASSKRIVMLSKAIDPWFGWVGTAETFKQCSALWDDTQIHSIAALRARIAEVYGAAKAESAANDFLNQKNEMCDRLVKANDIIERMQKKLDDNEAIMLRLGDELWDANETIARLTQER